MCYTYPTPKLSPHRRRCISIFPQKNSLCMIYKRFKLWGHWNVLINHLLLVIAMSYPCHYTNLCPHKPHKHAHTHTLIHTQTHTHTHHTTHTHTHTPHTHTHSLSHTLTHNHTPHTHTPTHTPTHTLSLSLSHTQKHELCIVYLDRCPSLIVYLTSARYYIVFAHLQCMLGSFPSDVVFKRCLFMYNVCETGISQTSVR